MILDYQNAKDGCALSLRDADEIERRSKEAGIRLIETEEQTALLKSEILQLQNVKKEQEGLLDDIKKVSSTSLKLLTVICQLRAPPLIMAPPIVWRGPSLIITDQNQHSFFNNCTSDFQSETSV